MKRTRFKFVAWPGLFIGCAVLEAIYLPALNARTEPTREERVNALLIAEDVDEEGLAKEWNAKKGERIKVVTPLFYSRHSSSLSVIFDSLGGTQDTFLLPSSFLAKESPTLLKMTFQPLPGIRLDDYQIDGVSYGILAFSHESQKNQDGLWSSYITYGEEGKDFEDYYVFFHQKSVHTKSYRVEGLDDEALALWGKVTDRSLLS